MDVEDNSFTNGDVIEKVIYRRVSDVYTVCDDDSSVALMSCSIKPYESLRV